MKRIVCLLLTFLCALPIAACNKEDAPAPRVWCVAPPSSAAEIEIRQMIREYDSEAYVSFVPAEDIESRLSGAIERGEAPDVFTVYADMIPDLAENKKLADLTDRLRLGNVKTDEMRDSCRRACVYQGKTWATPLFTDVYMLACNRELVSVAPDTFAQLKELSAELEKKGVKTFEKLSPEKVSLLFEAALDEYGGSMLSSRKTSLEFSSQAGRSALEDLTAILKNSADEEEATGEGKAAFSVLTLSERRARSEKYPDVEIELTPLFGLKRLQTMSVAMGADTKDQKRAYKLVEFLATESDKLCALYKNYSADKNLLPISDEDKSAVLTLESAKAAPDLCGFRALEKTYLPSAVDKSAKGVNAEDCLNEAVSSASPNIWKGKRE